ncbi:hypothetical protein HN51_065825 [Arachis hypogaea]
MFASKLGFNLDIPEVASFQKSSIPHGVSASQPISIVGSGKNIEIEEDFMKLTPRCTVKSLDDNNRVVFGTQSPPIFQENVGKTMLFKVLSRPVGMEKFKGTYPVRRVCDDAAIVGMFELSGSDLSPENI